MIRAGGSLALLGILATATALRAQESNLACRMTVAPASATAGTVIEFSYEFSGTTMDRIPDRYMKDEATFGHTLQLRSEDGRIWRFLRTRLWSYLADITPDSGVPAPRTYRFSFPVSQSMDNVRLVEDRDWRDPRAIRDEAGAAAYQRIWDSARIAIPPGIYQVSAEVPQDAFPRPQHGSTYRRRAVSCTAATLRILP